LARLHAAVYLATLFVSTDKNGVSKQNLERELKRLQLFDSPTTWILLTWEDFSSALMLGVEDELANPLTGDVIDGKDTGLYALQDLGNINSQLLQVRNRLTTTHLQVAYTKTKISWDGKVFIIEQEAGEWSADKKPEN